MKSILRIFFLIISLTFVFPVFSQNPEWITYTNGDWVYSLAEEGNDIWVGTWGGLVQLDKSSGTPTFYNTANSDLPDDFVKSITIDSSGNKWIGTRNGGLAKFSESNDWTFYDTSNSDLPNNSVRSIAIDSNGNKWIGTENGGLARFDGTTWEVYNTSNSGLPDDYVKSIVIDGSNNKWIGTDVGGLAVYNEGGVVFSVEKDKELTVTGYFLQQNYPNPFNPSTTIEFTLPKSEYVELNVFNILGKEVTSLVSNKLNQGNHNYTFDGKNLASGIYYYQLTAGDFREVKKMILLR